MEITLNGKLREVAVATTVTRLLEELKLHQLRVAVQVNLDIIKRDRYETVELKPGDKVEVLEPRSLRDVDARLAALVSFLALPEAASLTAANKRIANILKKSDP